MVKNNIYKANSMHIGGQGQKLKDRKGLELYFHFLRKADVLVLLWITFILNSCDSPGNRSNLDSSGSYEVSIIQRAGDDFQKVLKNDTIQYMNYPFNMGKFRDKRSKSIHCIVLSKNLGRKKQLDIFPIALLQLGEFGKIENYIIGIPVEKNQRSVDVIKYSDFVLTYSPIKSIIQNWLENRYGMGNSELIAWNDEHFAELFLEKSM